MFACLFVCLLINSIIIDRLTQSMNVKPGHRKVAFILKLVQTLSYRNA